MILQLVQISSELDAYLNFLFEGLEGYVYVATGERETLGKIQDWQQKFFKYPDELNAIKAYIKTSTGNREVYVAPGLYHSGDNHSRSNFKVSNVVWTELDSGRALSIASPGSSGWEIFSTPMPSLRLQSGEPGNEHWYWRLSNPIESAERLESINRGLCITFGADQSSWDATQILRPPETFNHKRGKLATSLLYNGGQSYSEEIFRKLEPTTPPIELDDGTIPDVFDVIMRYAFSVTFITLFKSSPVEGTRSTALMQLGYLGAEHGLTDSELFSIIRNADDRWGKFAGRTDRTRRLSDLITRVREKHPIRTSIVLRERAEAYGFKSFLDSEIKLEWLVPGLLDRSGYLLLTGPAGVGKTQWSLRWAINLALGKEFLGTPVTRPMKVVFFSLEMGGAALKYFLEQMASTLSEEDVSKLEENFIILPLGESLYLDGSDDQKFFEETIKEHKPEIAFVDSLGSSTSGELGESTVKLIMDFNDRIRQTYNVATWFVHHNRKAQADNRKPNKMSDVYGGQYIVNRATTVLCLWPDVRGIEVIELKKRLSELGDSWHIQRTATGLNFIRVADITLGTVAKELSYKQGAERPLTAEEKFEQEKKVLAKIDRTNLTAGL